jgi:hypothetical protein
MQWQMSHHLSRMQVLKSREPMLRAMARFALRDGTFATSHCQPPHTTNNRYSRHSIAVGRPFCIDTTASNLFERSIRTVQYIGRLGQAMDKDGQAIYAVDNHLRWGGGWPSRAGGQPDRGARSDMRYVQPVSY